MSKTRTPYADRSGSVNWNPNASQDWPRVSYVCPKCGYTVHVGIGERIADCRGHGHLVRAGTR